MTDYTNTNPSIKCSVHSCTHHKDAHCTLNEIQVGGCKNTVGTCQETECASFRLGTDGKGAGGCGGGTCH